jgi:hypothetical protein
MGQNAGRVQNPASVNQINEIMVEPIFFKKGYDDRYF